MNTDKMMAYCGLFCADCTAFRVTQTGDIKAKEQEALKWQRLFKRQEMDAGYITCDGCKSQSQRLCGHCSVCEVRRCALNRRVKSCALCADFPCTALKSLHTQLSQFCTMEDFFGYSYNPIEVLQSIHDRHKAAR